MTALTATMILGIVVLIGLFVWRFQSPAAPPLPETIVLGPGERAEAVTVGPGWVAVVTGGDTIVVFDRATGREIQRVRIAPLPE